MLQRIRLDWAIDQPGSINLAQITEKCVTQMALSVCTFTYKVKVRATM